MKTKLAYNILVVSWTFPPANGIGGRRWAKFSKYLSKNDEVETIHVITSKEGVSGSPWTKDIQNSDKICVHRTKSGFPQVLNSYPKSLQKKLAYRFWLLWLKLTRKGNYYERAYNWFKYAFPVAKEITSKQNIDTVIITGGPFYAFKIGFELKQLYPNIKLIFDYRDKWTDNKSFMGMNTLGEKRIQEEAKLEQEWLESADLVLTVADAMTESLRKRTQTRVETLTNGFDLEDFGGLENANNERNKIVFVGSFYAHLEGLLNSFLTFFSNDPESEKYDIDFYGPMDEKAKSVLKNIDKDNIKYHGLLSLQEAQTVIKNAKYCLLFLNDDHTFSMSTKCMEYLGLKKPVVVVSNKKGELARFLEKENIGVGVEKANLDKQIQKLLNNKFTFDMNNNVIQNFNVEKLTEELWKHINSSDSNKK